MNMRKTKAAMLVVPIVALLAVSCCISFVDSKDADAARLTGYGEPTVITIAPGYQYTYTVTVPSDLTAGTVLSMKVNDLQNISASAVTISGLKVTVKIPSSTTAGEYNLVLQAKHSASNQTAYQYIVFDVQSAMNVTSSGVVNEIIKGASQTITFNHTGGIGTVTWSVKLGTTLPAGLTLSGNKVTGTPTSLGINKIQLTATSSNGESKDLTVTFTVFSVIVGGTAQTITSIGGSNVSSDAVVNGSDLDVTWKVTSGTLPVGFTLDEDTGIISGGSSTYNNVVITLTGTANNGPSQTATKVVTIHSEPTLTLSTPDDVLTYKGNGASKTTTTVSNVVSKITYSVQGGSGVSIVNSTNAEGKAQTGTVTIKSPTAAGMSQIVTITAVTEFGQTKTVTFTEKVEDTLSATVPSSIITTAGTPGSIEVSASGGSGNDWQVSSSNVNIIGSYAGGNVTASAGSAQTGTLTVTVTSDAGQTVTKTVSITVYSILAFTSTPTNGTIAFAS